MLVQAYPEYSSLPSQQSQIPSFTREEGTALPYGNRLEYGYGWENVKAVHTSLTFLGNELLPCNPYYDKRRCRGNMQKSQARRNLDKLKITFTVSA